MRSTRCSKRQRTPAGARISTAPIVRTSHRSSSTRIRSAKTCARAIPATRQRPLRARRRAPGTSDHQTGLGADIVDQYYSSLSVDTVNARFLSWLADNCADYGFVIRYPSDKVSITGRNEPWHVRYVGDAAARFMTEHNLCLEEFVALYQ